MRSQPTVGGGVVFIGSQRIGLRARRKARLCMVDFNALSEVRGSITVELGEEDLPESLYFGDFQGHIYKLEALTGKLVWRRRVDPHPLTTLLAPWYSTRRIYSFRYRHRDSGRDGGPDYECCTFRGGIVAVDKASGETNRRLHLVMSRTDKILPITM